MEGFDNSIALPWTTYDALRRETTQGSKDPRTQGRLDPVPGGGGACQF